MTRIVVFSGPTLAHSAMPLDCEAQPPAQLGDMYRFIGAPPLTLVLIDGLFDAVRPPWHKEILELLAAGHRVIGAASMGALRAAELASFGVEGAGAICRAFTEGRLTADDEVAIVHAPEALGWRPLSDALVDIRATLATAVRQQVIGPASARALRSFAQSLFFADRSWPAILAGATIPVGHAARMREWLPGGRVDLKLADAHVGLALARSRGPSRQPLPEPPQTGLLAAAGLRRN